MTTNAKPPFRADHVGSFLRPPELKAARERFANGEIPAEALREVENASIETIVAAQEGVGLESITDGEFRRTFFHIDFLEKLEGVTVTQGSYQLKFRGHDKEVDFSPPVMSVTGRLGRPSGITTNDFAFINAIVHKTPKICIPSPTMLHFRGGRSGIDASAYPDLDDFFADLAGIYRDELADLAKLGCRFVQLDDTNLAYLCDPAHRDRVRSIGEDPDALPALYGRLISESVRGRADDMVVCVHLCRGNFQSTWAAEGPYEIVAEALFNEIDVDGFFLEFDDERSGGFEPLRFVPKNKMVVLGLVTTKVAELESADELKQRIDEASAFVDLDQLALSPQCGFSSTHHGNDISYDDQMAKLELVINVANDVWA